MSRSEYIHLQFWGKKLRKPKKNVTYGVWSSQVYRRTGICGNSPRGISDSECPIFEKTDVLIFPAPSHLGTYQSRVYTRGIAMLLRGKRRASAGKPLLRYLSVAVVALLVGLSAGRAIKARGSENGPPSDTTESGRGRRNVPTVDPPRSNDGAVALEGSIGTQDYEDNDNNSSNQELCMCLLLIVRDEESNLKANLPLWRDVAHCYVIGVDDRTTDGTMQAIHETLHEDTPRYDICVCAETGSLLFLLLFGTAVCSCRRRAFRYAWKNT